MIVYILRNISWLAGYWIIGSSFPAYVAATTKQTLHASVGQSKKCMAPFIRPQTDTLAQAHLRRCHTAQRRAIVISHQNQCLSKLVKKLSASFFAVQLFICKVRVQRFASETQSDESYASLCMNLLIRHTIVPSPWLQPYLWHTLY